MMLRLILMSFVLACVTFVTARADDVSSGPSREQEAFFESKIRPLLVQYCYDCHGPDSGKGEADLRLDSLEGFVKGGKSGPALVAGQPSQSLVMLAVKHDGAVAMPPKKKLAHQEIDLLAKWIVMGAPWPGAKAVSEPTHSAETPHRWSDEARQFWAFQPVRSVSLPDVKEKSWPLTPIDRFILARLEAASLRPAPQADKRTLIRRVTIDLLGVPPTVAEVDAFMNDETPEAFEHVVIRLLDSPLYGERWGRHWLDVARYADSNGMDDNLAYTDAWRYRDYVIASFNADKPFDRFVQEQLAGDLLARDESSKRDELTIATGFLSIGPKMLAEDDPVKQQLDIVDEQLDTTCRVFMGLTMGCVRCHDHKFDPLSMHDYYAMAGIFSGTQTMVSFRVDSKWNTTGLGDSQAAFRLEDLKQIIDRHDNALVNGNTTAMSADERTAHATLLNKAYQEYAAIPKAMSIAEGTGRDIEIRLRGNHLTRGAVAARGFPTIMEQVPSPTIQGTGSGRLEMARWMTSKQHPLTSRVIVNRVWRWHFGQGLVASVDNFGKLGEPPSHPELLDWMANQFVADGWSFKKLHRQILLSRTWQMNTAWNEHAAQVDPQNRLLWRMPRRRMDAEVVRDSLLAVSGQLDTTVGGAPMSTTPFQNLSLGGASRKPELYQSNRRSVYLPVLRGSVYDAFQAFDFPDPAVLNGDRMTTTVASQALFMLNGSLVEQSSKSLSDRLLNQERSDRERMQLACRMILCREASDEELNAWEQFLTRYQDAPSVAGQASDERKKLSWQGLCRALLSSNEFIYVN